MNAVRAKFKCSSKTIYEGENKQVTLAPVTGGSEENKEFWKYSPSGEIKMTINGPASDLFEPGKEYYIDFTPAN